MRFLSIFLLIPMLTFSEINDPDQIFMYDKIDDELFELFSHDKFHKDVSKLYQESLENIKKEKRGSSLHLINRGESIAYYHILNISHKYLISSYDHPDYR